MLMNWKIVVPLLAVAFIVTSAAGTPGGVVDAAMKDQTTRDALQFAVAEYNKRSNDLYVWQMAKVVKVQKQVWALSGRRADGLAGLCGFRTPMAIKGFSK